jgi:hypothetical protein
MSVRQTTAVTLAAIQGFRERRFVAGVEGALRCRACYLMIACFASLYLSADAFAARVFITVTGVLASGTDYSGVFGTQGGDLTGESFTLVFTVDDTAGVQNKATCSGGVSDFTSITSTASSNPATATLTIGGGSFTFGVLNASYEANSEVARYASTSTCSVDSQIYLAAGDGYYGNGSGLNGYVYPATGTILTSNANWEGSFSDANLYVSPVGAGSLQFEISEQEPKPTRQSASGFLIPRTITVSGPTTCSSANVTLFFGAFGPQNMQAAFLVPNSAAAPAPATTLPEYAATCGFASFDWQQQITVDPGGDTIRPSNPSLNLMNISPIDGSLVAGPSSATGLASNYPAYYDPPPGGYIGGGYTEHPVPNSYPFFYPHAPSPEFVPGGWCTLISPASTPLCPPYPLVVSADDTALSFFDDPTQHNLRGVAPATNPPVGTFLAFSTSLVGISTQPIQGSVSCGTGSALYCTTLYSWTWNSTFNGTAGGVSQTASIYPIDPGSGTGGITITSINGVQLPSVVSANQVATTASGLAYSRVSQTFNGTVTLRNISSSVITGPLQILFAGMPANVTLVNATANLSGTPYLTVPAVASLAPGQSVTVGIQFKNPSNATINLAPVVYSGSIN